MRGERVVGIAMLVLAGVIATPALSAAQEADPPAPAVSITTEPAPAEDADQGTTDEEAGSPGSAGVQPARAGPTPPADGDATAPAPTTTPASTTQTSAAPGAGAAAASASVSMGDNFYSPPSISVNVGDAVTWTNNGQASHSATADDGSFDTGVFGPGGSRSVTFDTPGTFGYYCTVHGRIQSGTVRVAAAGGGGGGGGSGAAAPSEADAVASPGAAGSDSSLPATGLAAFGLAATGALLLGSGLFLRRRSGTGESA